jgi:hypothetical protein
MEKHFLFSKNLLQDVLEYQNNSIMNRIENIPKDQFLNTSEDQIIEHVESFLKINPLRIFEDDKTMEQSEVDIDVSHIRSIDSFGRSGPILAKGIRVVVSIPYTGDEDLWRSATSRTFGIYCGRVNRKTNSGIGIVDIIYEQPINDDPAKIKNFIEVQINGIKSEISEQYQLIENYNNGIRTRIEQSIRVRKERLKKHEDIIDFIGIPLKKRDGVPEYKKIDITKRIIKPLPSASKDGYKPEPGISIDDFEYILNIIRHEGRTFESTPKTFNVHNEEELRDILLAHLNGHLQGNATGETFRKKGRTDIRIEDDNRAAFVGECKIWYGKKELFEAIDQLLGYLTWRDCKAALIVFNKNNKKFSDLLITIPNSVISHSHFIKELSSSQDGEWRYLFKSEEDENRQIMLHVFVFNIYYK